MQLVYGPFVRFVFLTVFILALGCTDGSGGSLCGGENEACCGVAFCDDGLACVAGTCVGSSCGGAYQACCTMGMPCGSGLMCDMASCVPDTMMSDGGMPISDCGARGEACCSSGAASCEAGLACVGSICMDAPPCGAESMACCAGDECDTGNVCAGGVCRREVPIPMCTAAGGACSASADCCSMNCSGGVCSSGGPPPPPPPSCGSAFSCYDCAADSDCGWCDGGCTAVTNRAGCTDFRETILDCFL